ncbi:hypothetical protein EDD16DRAFT_986039 [Pisolithus croceorrhizus]|nr:hypothetical protein EDD16DRAFT_986039 [Pisolithus croceorrhizus]
MPATRASKWREQEGSVIPLDCSLWGAGDAGWVRLVYPRELSYSRPSSDLAPAGRRSESLTQHRHFGLASVLSGRVHRCVIITSAVKSSSTLHKYVGSECPRVVRLSPRPYIIGWRSLWEAGIATETTRLLAGRSSRNMGVILIPSLSDRLLRVLLESRRGEERVTDWNASIPESISERCTSRLSARIIRRILAPLSLGLPLRSITGSTG